ncbi:MAG: TetR/AcrR family transcriptional regulator [Velocimicrobium sp.]
MCNRIKFMNEKRENPLIEKQELFNASLDEFSQKSFNEASLNNILKAVKMNKGSFYYRFYDKTDLYLSMIHRIGIDKLKYLTHKTFETENSQDFFESMQLVIMLALEYARHEKRYYSFWRNYLAESPDMTRIVKDAFPEFGTDILRQLVNSAVINKQIPDRYNKDFVYTILSIFFHNFDALVESSMSNEEVVNTINAFIEFIKYGFIGRE